MRNVKFWGILVIGVSILFALYAAVQTGEKSPIMASGTVQLSPDLTKNALGMRTVFIVVYDANSPMPMPFGAMKERIEENAEGEFLSFHITKERISQMNPSAATPKSMRIKVRLDQDGMGGMDQPGDITGSVNDVAFGATDVKILLNTVKS